MAKTTEETLTDAVASQLVTYLGSGNLNQRVLTQAIDFSGLNISNLERLKELHFVLSDDVADYIKKLPGRLRRVKTVNQQSQFISRGEVRGRVQWEATQRRRYKEGYDDPTLFVVSTPEVEYDIPENLVLKKLLATIARPLSRDIEGVEQGWRTVWGDTDIVDLQQTLARNVYLSRLPDPDEISLTGRDHNRARQSRQPLYAEAQRLYQLYEDLLNDRLEKPAVQQLLTNTLVLPQRTSRLFELYCLFGVIERIRDRYNGLTLQRIAPDTGAIATLEHPDMRVEIFFDDGGPLSFFESYPRASKLTDPAIPEMIRRQARALEEHEATLEAFLGRDTDRRFYSGRPDILILRYKSNDERDQLTEAIIGEVKHTQSPSTFSTGLRELMEYIYFAQENGEYLFQTKVDSSISVTGLICTDGVDVNQDSVDKIHHLSTEDLSYSR